MTRKQYRQFYSRLRKIRNARMVGTHGHYSDLVKEFGVSMCFIRNLNDMSKPLPRLIYNRYTTQYQDEQNYIADCDSYYERIVGA